MLERQKGGVFLSYARQDGENFAQELRTRLRREGSDIVIKQDRIFLEGGLGWWKQITEAIDSVLHAGRQRVVEAKARALANGEPWPE